MIKNTIMQSPTSYVTAGICLCLKNTACGNARNHFALGSARSWSSLPKLGRRAGFTWIQPQMCVWRPQAPLVCLFFHSIHMLWGAKGTTETIPLICHSPVAELFKGSCLPLWRSCLLEGGQLAEKNARRSWVSVWSPGKPMGELASRHQEICTEELTTKGPRRNWWDTFN